MGCHGGFFLEEAVRRRWYNPEEILKEIGLRPGMIFADVGCGDGFFSVLAAGVAGNSGKVYAVDSDAHAIDKLKRKAAKSGLTNVDARVGLAEETIFCGECADIVFYSMVLHDFNDPAAVLQNARKTIKPSGTQADLDWKKKRMPFGPPVHIRFSEQQAASLITQAGFKVETVKDAGLLHYLILAKPCQL
jgi:ubiquinone/menaquinone biosynthesis C-methylase UbiE